MIEIKFTGRGRLVAPVQNLRENLLLRQQCTFGEQLGIFGVGQALLLQRDRLEVEPARSESGLAPHRAALKAEASTCFPCRKRGYRMAVRLFIVHTQPN
ncbi:MAG: hypothetical protein V4508_08260 [Pseudomonadota bacterium]